MIAAELDTTIQLVLRALHEHGIPVRRGGAPRTRDTADTRERAADTALRRLTALYQDPDVVALLREHHIPQRPMPGTITERFPTPVPVTREFLTAAYTDIGLAAAHIEQLTGQPAERILQQLHHHQIPVRHTLARSPWLQRQQHN
jgi:hypothetical protein